MWKLRKWTPTITRVGRALIDSFSCWSTSTEIFVWNYHLISNFNQFSLFIKRWSLIFDFWSLIFDLWSFFFCLWPFFFCLWSLIFFLLFGIFFRTFRVGLLITDVEFLGCVHFSCLGQRVRIRKRCAHGEDGGWSGGGCPQAAQAEDHVEGRGRKAVPQEQQRPRKRHPRGTGECRGWTAVNKIVYLPHGDFHHFALFLASFLAFSSVGSTVVVFSVCYFTSVRFEGSFFAHFRRQFHGVVVLMFCYWAFWLEISPIVPNTILS